MLVEDATLLESTEGSQVMETKCKEITIIFLEDKVEQWSFKKVKGKQLGKYCRDTTVKMEMYEC